MTERVKSLISALRFKKTLLATIVLLITMGSFPIYRYVYPHIYRFVELEWPIPSYYVGPREADNSASKIISFKSPLAIAPIYHSGAVRFYLSHKGSSNEGRVEGDIVGCFGTYPAIIPDLSKNSDWSILAFPIDEYHFVMYTGDSVELIREFLISCPIANGL